MDDTAQVTVTIPTSLLTALDARAARQGESRDNLLRRLLEQALAGSTDAEADGDVARYLTAYRQQPQTEDEFGWSDEVAVQHLTAGNGQ